MMWRSRSGLIVALVGIVAGAAVLTVLRTRSPGIAIEPSRDRNVLLVTIDTLRADALGAYGGRAMTPTIDRLASTGARFDFAHAHAVVTLPSHASILSGRYPYEHGVRDNTGYRFPAQTPTIATLLKEEGFATGAFIGGFPLVRQFGLSPGFDVYDDQLGHAGSGDRRERERPAPAVIAAATQWIGSQRARWFSWIHLYDPHAPYAPPGEWASRFPSHPYLGEVSATDAALGPLIEHLRSGARPTLVIVTADHGESLGDHGEPTHGTFAYESTLRVPLIIADVRSGEAPPDRTGVVLASAARHVDLAPTILEAVEARGSSFSGTSLWDAIKGNDTADRPSYFEAMSASVTRGWAPLRGVLVERHKYIDLPLPELYDLQRDAAETVNLAAAQGERRQVLANVLKAFDMAPPVRSQAETAATVERLRSLGYVAGASAGIKDRYTEDDDPKRLIQLEKTMADADAALSRGNVPDAERMYQSVIEQRADMEDAYRKLALLYWRTGRPADAVTTLERAVRNGLTQNEVIVKLGQYLAESGQALKAIALLEGRMGDDPDALIVLGNAYAYTARYRDAAATFSRALAMNPEDAVALENLGAMQLQLGDRSAAERTLRRAIELDPALAGAHTTLGVLLAQTGRRDEAIAAWTRALELDPNDQNARHNLGSLRRR